MTNFRRLADADVRGKRVLLRVDFNVPMEAGRVTDTTRIESAYPTIQALLARGAIVLLATHFGRPKGKVTPEMSLAPVAPTVGKIIGKSITFVPDSIGPTVADAIAGAQAGDVFLLENTRFYAGEEANDPAHAAALAANADLFVNDAFSAAHRAHASTEGVAKILPAYAGKAMERELDHLEAALGGAPRRPVMAVVGGAKVSSKISVLENLVKKADVLAVGGGMANTFLAARGHDVGKSLCEADLFDTVRRIEAAAAEAGCMILLPADVVVAKAFQANAPHRVCAPDEVAPDEMILDAGPMSVDALAASIDEAATLVWNGPLGAFEMVPFDTATVEAAQYAARRTKENGLISVAGGGDTVAALNHARAADGFTFVSTAGGAFLEWMEGRDLPGVEALQA